MDVTSRCRTRSGLAGTNAVVRSARYGTRRLGRERPVVRGRVKGGSLSFPVDHHVEPHAVGGPLVAEPERSVDQRVEPALAAAVDRLARETQPELVPTDLDPERRGPRVPRDVPTGQRVPLLWW